LDADLVDEFEEHLLFCQKCRNELERKETLIHAIQLAAAQLQKPGGRDEESRKKDNQSRHNEHIHDNRWRYVKKTKWLLRIAAVFVFVLFGTSVIGVWYEFNSTVGSRRNIIAALSDFYGSLLGIGKRPYRRPIDRYVTEDFVAQNRLNEQPGYKPNELLEEFILDQYRTSNPLVEVQKPIMDENFTTDISGRINLRYEGFCKYPDIVNNNRIVLRIFTNQEQDYIDENSIISAELSFNEEYLNFYRFEEILTVKMRKGLYYYTVEMEKADPLFVGKFYINTLSIWR
jgi:hypothetical protein